MGWTFFLAAVLFGEPGGNTCVAASIDSSAERAPGERGFHEYQQAISSLLKEEAQARTEAAKAKVVRRMCAVHAELVHDSRYATSDVLKEYRGRLWSRLTKIKSELKQQLAKSRGGKDSLDTLAALEQADAASVVAAESLAVSLSLLDQTPGNPGRLLAFGGGAVAPDWGPDLVDLIERTINPAFWDTIGGPGSIYYYRPLQCLVIRATAEVHGNVSKLLGDVRR